MIYSERRQHKRYLVVGTAVVNSSSSEIAAELVGLSRGGVLVLAPSDSVTVGEKIRVRFAIADYPAEIEAKGQVTRIDTGTIAISFVDPPVELEEAVLWLEAGFFATLLKEPLS
jgi:hypothetical protein